MATVQRGSCQGSCLLEVGCRFRGATEARKGKSNAGKNMLSGQLGELFFCWSLLPSFLPAHFVVLGQFICISQPAADHLAASEPRLLICLLHICHTTLIAYR